MGKHGRAVTFSGLGGSGGGGGAYLALSWPMYPGNELRSMSAQKGPRPTAPQGQPERY
jgi:hypothetical protein